jgi:hypothetical protein
MLPLRNGLLLLLVLLTRSGSSTVRRRPSFPRNKLFDSRGLEIGERNIGAIGTFTTYQRMTLSRRRRHPRAGSTSSSRFPFDCPSRQLPELGIQLIHLSLVFSVF